MGNVIAALEHATANMLNSVSVAIENLATFVDSAPLSSTCQSMSFLSQAEWPSSGWYLMLVALLLFVAFVFSTSLFFSYMYNHVPHLETVPQPATSFDPDLDSHSEDFCDEDVRPQLTLPSIRPSIHAISPETGKSLGYVKAHTPEEVPSLVAKARAAQEKWCRSSFNQRRQVLKVLYNYLLYEQKMLCEISMRDTGKTLVEASLGEIIPTLEKLRWLIAEGEATLQPSLRSVGPMTLHKQAQVEYHPLGVLIAIAPWNYPLHNIFNPVSAALFAGCSIVVKPSEHAVWSSVYFIRIIRRALSRCGESPDLVQCAIGGGDVAEQLVKSNIDKIFFTGSTAIGRKVALAAAEGLKPSCLELGGKDAFVVCEDADIEHAITICLRGVFQNAGQNCIGIERVFVHVDVIDQFIKSAVPLVRRMRLGVDVGAITMGETAIDRIQHLVDDAISKGATLMVGGKRGEAEQGGWYYEATVLTNVSKKMKIAREEVFGPIMCVYEWTDDMQLIHMVNDCDFGLGCSIFTSNKERATTLRSSFKVGMCNINDFATNYLCQSMPFGGTKQSGSDRFAGIEGLRGCCRAVSTTLDKYPGIKTRVPRALQYPVAPNAFELTTEINDLMYGYGILSKIDNIRQVLGMILVPAWKPRTVGSG